MNTKDKRVIIVDGVEYVTMSEFAERIGVWPSSVQRAITAGRVKAKSIDGSTSKYLDWKKMHTAWVRTAKKRNTVKARNSSGYAYLNVPADSKPSATAKTKLDNASIKRIDPQKDGKGLVDLNALDEFEHSDCWAYRDGEPILDPHTSKHMFDYALLEKKLKAQNYYVALQEKKRELIPREEVKIILGKIAVPMKNGILGIASRCVARQAGILEKELGLTLSAETRTLMRTLIDEECRRILKDMQEAVKEATDDTK